VWVAAPCVRSEPAEAPRQRPPIPTHHHHHHHRCVTDPTAPGLRRLRRRRMPVLKHIPWQSFRGSRKPRIPHTHTNTHTHTLTRTHTEGGGGGARHVGPAFGFSYGDVGEQAGGAGEGGFSRDTHAHTRTCTRTRTRTHSTHPPTHAPCAEAAHGPAAQGAGGGGSGGGGDAAAAVLMPPPPLPVPPQAGMLPPQVGR
jgi:hypothetical protein